MSQPQSSLYDGCWMLDVGCWMLDGMRGDDEREKMDFQPKDMTPS